MSVCVPGADRFWDVGKRKEKKWTEEWERVLAPRRENMFLVPVLHLPLIYGHASAAS